MFNVMNTIENCILIVFLRGVSIHIFDTTIAYQQFGLMKIKFV